MKKTLLIIGIVLLLALGGLLYYFYSLPAPVRTDSPADPGTLTVESIKPQDLVAKRFVVSGEAYSAWFEEGKMPAEVVDPKGNELWIGYAITNGDWTTDATIPFSMQVDVGHYAGPATVVIHRDNPSGDPAYDKSISIPIIVGDETGAAAYAYNPGDILIYSLPEGGVVAARFTLEGSANTRWFSGSSLAVEVLAADGDTLLWRGSAKKQASTASVSIADFSLNADVGAYKGPAQVVFTAPNPDNDPDYQASYSFTIMVR